MDKLLLNFDNSQKLNADEIYAYLLIQNNNFCNVDLHSISLKNCLLEKCTFSNALLANSDFDSSQINSCIFENHSFQNSDIVSCNFEHCTFNHISFKGATITNTTFNNCVFISCDFNHIDMNDSTFQKCIIENMNMRQSSTSLNNFSACTFRHSRMNGNFAYNLVMNCTYEDTTMDISLISSNFGIIEKNIQELNMSISGLKNYQQELLLKNDIFGAAIIELNSNDYSYDYSIAASIQVIAQKIQNDLIIRSEELRFVELILDYFISNDLLAPITIIQLLSLVESIQNSTIDNIAKHKAVSYINYIYNVLFKSYRKHISELHNILEHITLKDLPVTIKLTFKEEPSIQVCTLLAELQRQLNILAPPPQRIKTEKGSFIDWIEGHDSIIKCLQLIVSILGIGIKIKPSSKKNPASASSDFNNSGNNTGNNSTFSSGNTIVLQIPNSIISQIDQVQTEQDLSKVVNVFVINGMTINNNYKGFNKHNVNNIECFYG